MWDRCLRAGQAALRRAGHCQGTVDVRSLAGVHRAALAGALERYQGGAPIEPTTWIRATAKDVALIHQLGVRETGMLASASDYHTFHKFSPGGRQHAAQTYL